MGDLADARRAERAQADTKPTLRAELEELINRHSAEAVSDSPDYILASFLVACLYAFNGATVERDRWHGWRDGQPGRGGPLTKWSAQGGPQ